MVAYSEGEETEFCDIPRAQIRAEGLGVRVERREDG